MIKIAGVNVFDTLSEILDPAHSAVLVIDMQNDQCSPNGAVAKAGVDNAKLLALVRPVARFLDEARRFRVPVVFCQTIGAIDGRVTYPPPFLRTVSRVRKSDLICVEGTWGAELLPEMKRRPDEPVLIKYCSGFFTNTGLDWVLRSMGIQTVVVVGEQTAGCVFGAARGASDNGYYCVVVSDCIAAYKQEQHDAAITIMRERYEVVPSEKIVQEWAKIAPKTGSK